MARLFSMTLSQRMAETRGLRISLNLILAELVAYLKVKDRLVLGLVLLRLS
jgi:hypothetical protein